MVYPSGRSLGEASVRIRPSIRSSLISGHLPLAQIGILGWHEFHTCR
jgi:hypothetical protein